MKYYVLMSIMLATATATIGAYVVYQSSATPFLFDFGIKNKPFVKHDNDATDTSSFVVKSEESMEQKESSEEILGNPTGNLTSVSDRVTLLEEPPLPIPRERLSQQTLYTIASEHVINMFCEAGEREVAIATGVIIHEKGIILTNAHIVPGDEPQPCLVRRGSPARNYALAERIFTAPRFSPHSASRENLAQDVALWKITKIIENKQPQSFSSLPVRATRQPVDGERLSTFSYPAELLGSQTIVSSLHLSFSETVVKSHDAYFIESLQGIGSQKGSSGGVLIDPYTGKFAGLIFAINDAKTESISERTLFSLTPFAVTEAVRTATGKDLDVYLAEVF